MYQGGGLEHTNGIQYLHSLLLSGLGIAICIHMIYTSGLHMDMRAHKRTYTHTHMHSHTRVHVRTHVRAQTRRHVSVRTHAQASIRTHAHRTRHHTRMQSAVTHTTNTCADICAPQMRMHTSTHTRTIHTHTRIPTHAHVCVRTDVRTHTPHIPSMPCA
jgi:hypothetical protein